MGKVEGKPNALTCWCGNLPKIGDILDKYNNYQYHVILKPHSFAILSNQHPFDSFSSSYYCQDITLHVIQLYLEPYFTNQYLAAIFLDEEKALDNNDRNKIVILFEPEFDLVTDQTQHNDDHLDVPIETMWDLVKKRDKFAPLILKLLKEKACYHKSISLAECED